MVVVIASENKGKIAEFDRILRPLGFDVVSRKSAGMNKNIEETGQSFVENAKIKALQTYETLKLPVIADDSGLEVLALGGAPGIYSARYSAKPGIAATDEGNNQKLLKALEGVEDRRARYVCALCFINQDGKMFNICEICEGEISTHLEGHGGFGYDPLFKFKGVSFANMRPQQKDAVSHRAKALLKLTQKIEEWK